MMEILMMMTTMSMALNHGNERLVLIYEFGLQAIDTHHLPFCFFAREK